MKLLSSFLIAAYANTVVDEKECHVIDNHGNYRKFAGTHVAVTHVAGTNTALELVPATAGDDDTDGVPDQNLSIKTGKMTTKL